MNTPLTDTQRRLIHDLALEGRALLTREARELLEGDYGLYADGRLDPPERLPLVQTDPDAAETYRRMARFLDDEAAAGLPRREAVDKLVKEVAFTHLNRLVAFKMMEARKLIRGTLDKGPDSNAFKFYLADPAHAADLERHQRGEVDAAYRHFLLWQAGQVAREVRVLFNPDTLPSRLFPRPRALQELLALLNRPELAPCWQADETIGWLYQFFNEQEKADVFERLYKKKQKIRRQDLPAATQLFTPHWIVRFLVQNTLGRLWVELHPDTRLLGTELLDYLAPVDLRLTIDDLRLKNDDAPDGPIVNRKSKIVNEITLLDPACGTMHFGLVAFDLFAAMYREELDRAGEAGWPAAPSVSDPADIPAAIIAHNLFGIDIDLRAVQLSALALYLKAKRLNPKAKLTNSNLASADVLPLNGARLGAFLKEARFERPIYERLIRRLWAKLKDLNEIGSLLRLEEELESLIAAERARFDQAPLFAGLPGEFEREAAEQEFWAIIGGQVLQALDEFGRRHAAAGDDVTFFVGEAAKGLRVLELMARRYAVVVTNPPYSGKRNLGDKVAAYLDDAYPSGKGDLYTAFILRCAELTEDGGWLGMITQQSFMFLSSYEKLRAELRDRFAVEALAHTGPRAFAEISGEKVNTTVFTLRAEPDTPRRQASAGCYYRLVNAPEGDGKRLAFEQALADSAHYSLPQRRFDAIPGSPWVYWVSEGIRELFETLPDLQEIAKPTVGLQTGENARFLRYWWEVSHKNVAFNCENRSQAQLTKQRWFPYMKGGGYTKWYGNQSYVVNWYDDGQEIQNFYGPSGRLASRPQNTNYYFREGITYSYLTSAHFSARYSPGGFMFDVAGSSLFPDDIFLVLSVMNSSFAAYALKLINPTVNFQVGDLARLPIPTVSSVNLYDLIRNTLTIAEFYEQYDETTLDFIAPPRWESGLADLAAAQSRLAQLEAQIDDEVYRLYGLSAVDRAAIEAELNGGSLAAEDDDDAADSAPTDSDDDETAAAPITAQELAVRWISYAIGVVLGRFTVGAAPAAGDSTPSQPPPARGRSQSPPQRGGLRGGEKSLGSAVYHRAAFAVGSLPAPDEAEFDQLVGPAARFAWVDKAGGRHLFPAEVETALNALALPDGIAVLDEGHPRDLPALVEQALSLMLGETAAAEVITLGTGGSLRKFLERDYFTKWHLGSGWYRKRPVYWPLQSAKRSYGFVVFHEKVGRDFLYVLLREFLDHKLNGLQLAIGDMQAQLPNLQSSARKRLERDIDKTSAQLDEVKEFFQTIDRLVRAGYEPQPTWIDDGVILRLAPLWELLPIWKSEPKKHWERLERGDFDWSHIAMRYWPERVKAACQSNKSFAIAHGLETLYQGG